MKKKYPRSFSRRITNRVIAIVLVTMLLLSGWVFYHSVTRFGQQIGSHFIDVMEITNEEMDLWLSAVEISAANIEDEISYNLNRPSNVCTALADELHLNPYVNGACVGFIPNYFSEAGRWFEPYASRDSVAGEINIRQIGSRQHDYFGMEWYKNGLEHPEGRWSDPYFDRDGARAVVCTYSIPVRDRKGNTVAVMGADLKLEWLKTQLEENDTKENARRTSTFSFIEGDPTYRTYSFILGNNGEFIVHPDTSRVLKKTFFDYADPDDDGSYIKAGRDMMEGKTGSSQIHVNGQAVYVYYGPLQSTGWSMGIVVPVKSIALPGVLLGFLMLLFIGLAVIVIMIVCRMSIHSTTRPLVKLAASAEEIAKGNFKTELPRIKRRDEICRLRDSFEDMQHSLSTYVAQLTAATAQRASIESELNIARDIQMSMLPKAFPDRPDVKIFASLTPAKIIGGDMYDFHIRDNMLFFCIGDVSGKGVPASLVMAGINTQFHALSAHETQPDVIIEGLNEAMTGRNESLMFATFFVGMISLSSGAFHFCNAGHNVPIVIDADGAKFLDVESNIPLGIDSEWRYLRQNKVIAPGTTILLYTDGLTEAENTEHNQFGEERVLQLLSEWRGCSPKDIISKLTDAVHAFTAGAEQSDDLTMLAIRYK